MEVGPTGLTKLAYTSTPSLEDSPLSNFVPSATASLVWLPAEKLRRRAAFGGIARLTTRRRRATRMKRPIPQCIGCIFGLFRT